MALIDLEAREVHAKLVYFGPELSGKTTTLRAIADGIPAEASGVFRTISSESARTIFADSLAVDFGERFGLRFVWHLYTVPGQPRSSGPREAVLHGTDGVAFVADSAPLRQAENLTSLQELQQLLARQDRSLANTAFVLQANKADLPDALGADYIANVLGVGSAAVYATSAVTGTGVFDALRDVSRQIAQRL